MRIKNIIFLAFLSLTALFVNQAAAQTANRNLANDLNRAFRQYNIIKISPRDAARVKAGQFQFAARDRAFSVALQPRDLLAANYRAEETTILNQRAALPRPAAQTFKGAVAGDKNAVARFSIVNGKIAGYVLTGDKQQFFVEPARNISKSAASDDFVVYEAADVLNNQPLSCGLHEETEAANEKIGVAADNQLVVSRRVVEIATDADYEFVQQRGGAANAIQEALVVLNLIEGRYEAELGLTFAVTFQHAWSTNDPFNSAVRPPNLPGNIGTSALNNALGWFAQTWNNDYPTAQYPRDVAHLFSGKNELNARGVAFNSTICANPAFAYSLNGYIDVQSAKYLLAAHEIGHNFGASHADAAQSCAGSIMNTILAGDTPLTFCQFSRDQMIGFVNNSGSCLAQQSATRAKYDFDGDNKTDIALWRPSDAVWYRLNSGSNNAFYANRFGVSTDRPTPADFDGDGKTDIAVYRPSNGTWYILNSSNNTVTYQTFGVAEDIPAPADFSGDGKSEVAVYRPSNGIWYIYNLQNGAFNAENFGVRGDIPLPNDFDGDNKADIAVFRPSNNVWYQMRSGGSGFYAVQWGVAGDVPAAADYNGDSKTDIAVFRPSNGFWWILETGSNAISQRQWGVAGDVPAPGDFDGDNKADINVYRPSNGVWYRLNSNSGGFVAERFGLLGDVPSQIAPAVAVQIAVQ